MSTLTIELKPEQLKELAILVAAELRGSTGTSPAEPCTVGEAARRLKLSTDTVRRHVKAGFIKKIPNTRRVLIPHSEITRLLAQ